MWREQKLVFSENNNQLMLEIYQDKEKIFTHCIQLESNLEAPYIFLSILNAIKPHLQQLLHGTVAMDVQCTTISDDVFIKLGYVLRETQILVRKYRHLEEAASSFDNILFYNVDEGSWIQGIYQQYQQDEKERLYYDNMNTSYDRYTRDYSGKLEMKSPQEFIDYLIEYQIKKVITINYYYLQYTMNEYHVHLLTVLEALNIDFVMIDYDTFDMPYDGFLAKAVYTDGWSERFSTYPHFQSYWDEKYELKNIHYVINPQYFGIDSTIHLLDDDYKIAVLSNARVDLVYDHLGALVYILERLPNKTSLYSEFNLWHYAFRKLLLTQWVQSDGQRAFFNNILHRIYFSMISLIRFEVIDQLKTERGVEIYGDNDWGELFPQYYQKKYLNHQEKDALFSNKQYLYLLFNNSYSYMETNPSVMDAISKTTPFINFSPLAKTPSLSGFANLEYDDVDNLNKRISDVNRYLNHEEFQQSLQYYKSVLHDNEQLVRNNILYNQPFPTGGGLFGFQCRQHQRIIDFLLNDYIQKNYEMLEQCYKMIFLNSGETIELNRSRLFEREYMQKIIWMKHR